MSIGWRTAFINQGMSDYQVYCLLSRLADQSKVERCHSLHYLQMACEKIAKGLTLTDENTQPPRKHNSLVTWMRIAANPSRPRIKELMALCNISSNNQFIAYIKGMIPIVELVEAFAPAVADAKGSGVNSEYPWKDNILSQVEYPANYSFLSMDPRFNPKMRKFVEFIEASLKFGALYTQSRS